MGNSLPSTICWIWKEEEEKTSLSWQFTSDQQGFLTERNGLTSSTERHLVEEQHKFWHKTKCMWGRAIWRTQVSSGVLLCLGWPGSSQPNRPWSEQRWSSSHVDPSDWPSQLLCSALHPHCHLVAIEKYQTLCYKCDDERSKSDQKSFAHPECKGWWHWGSACRPCLCWRWSPWCLMPCLLLQSRWGKKEEVMLGFFCLFVKENKYICKSVYLCVKYSRWWHLVSPQAPSSGCRGL